MCVVPRRIASAFRKKLCQGLLFGGAEHPSAEKSSPRDDFLLRNASLCREKLSQGCFPSAKCIPLQKKTLPEMISFCEMHPSAEKSSPRDDFLLRNASLYREKLSQGCFPSAKCIPLQKKALPEIISFCEMHPSAEKNSPKDAFLPRNASLYREKLFQG